MIGIAGRTKYRISGLALAFVITLVSLAGCGAHAPRTKEGGYRIYDLNKDMTTIVSRNYDTGEQDPDRLLGLMLDQLGQKGDPGQISPISGFQVEQAVNQDGALTLNLSDGYLDLDRCREALTRAAIVLTLCQIPGIESVAFVCHGAELADVNGRPYGSMTRDSFINNSDSEIQNYEKVRLHLYFTSSGGDQLISTYRTIVYNSNISMERLVTEQILKGPNSDVVYPTLNDQTKILNVTTRDGVCYVNLDAAFLTEPYQVTPQVAIYSLVNSLTELPSVRQVQISVEGNTQKTFMESLSLTAPFEKNAGLIQQNYEPVTSVQ